MTRNAEKDQFGFPSMLGVHNGQTRQVEVGEDGSLKISQAKTFLGSITLDLSSPREKQVFSNPFSEITFSVVSGKFTFYPGEPVDNPASGELSNKMTIDKAMHMAISGQSFYISNESQVGGKVEIWLWK